MKFDDRFLDEIKRRNNIEDVISSYVTLKRSGSNLKGLCPFHNEKTPSFTVYNNDAEQSFYCFGCGVGGNVITFIMRAEGLEFAAAVEYLANRAGVPMPSDLSEADIARIKKQKEFRSRIAEMNKEAASYFFENLKKSSVARNYAGKRGLDASTLIHFGVGYADEDFSSLTDYLKSKGYSEEEMIRGSLSRKSSNGRLYDYFRARLIFPIIDEKNQVVAFGGRIMGDGQPKYLNSTDSPVYQKKKTLFGLNFAKKTKLPYFILCEGYMDVIALHKSGFDSAVASCGTSLTSDQAYLIKRYTENVVLCYDSDSAGQNATERAISILESVGLKTKVVVVKDAKDPDEFIEKFGKEAFKKLIDESSGEFEWTLNIIKSQHNLESVDGVADSLKEVARKIAGYDDSTRRELYIRKAAAEFGVSVAKLTEDVEANRKYKDRYNKKKLVTDTINRVDIISDNINKDRARFSKEAKVEDTVISIILNHPETSVIDECRDLTEDDIKTGFNKRLLFYILDAFKNYGTGYKIDFNEDFTPDEVAYIFRIKRARESFQDNEDSLREAIKTLKRLADAGREMSIQDYIEKKRREFEDGSEK